MPDLSLQRKGQRLRIYIGESDHWRGKPLYSAILETFRSHGMAGATVFRGLAGYGAHSHIRSSSIEVLSVDLPVVIEAVDTPEKIKAILDVVYPMVGEGLITLDDVEIIKYTHRYLNPLPADRLVSEVMTRDVVSVRPDIPVHLAWKQMLERTLKAIPVVDDSGRVVGIFTDEDLLERAGIRQRMSVAIRMGAEEINQEMDRLEKMPQKVADVMTRPAITALEKESLGVVTSRIVKRGLKRLPVVDEEGKLVGVISRLDILRQVANSSREAPPAHIPTGGVRVVKDIMDANMPIVSENDHLPVIVDKFSQSNSHRLIVVDDTGKATGVVSDSDVVARVQPAKRTSILDALRRIGKPPVGKETAFDLMSIGVLTVQPDMPIADAVKQLLSAGRKFMIVVDEQQKPLGWVDRQILLDALSSYYKT
jgi:CBS-domain-containing membrane protein